MADAAAAAAAAAQEPLDRIVLRYLQKRGYKDAEKALLAEAKIQSVSQMALVPHLGADASISDHILYYNEADCDPNALVQGYRMLREWVHNSLDLYKVGAKKQKERGEKTNLTRTKKTYLGPPSPVFFFFLLRDVVAVCLLFPSPTPPIPMFSSSIVRYTLLACSTATFIPSLTLAVNRLLLHLHARFETRTRNSPSCSDCCIRCSCTAISSS